MEDVDSVRKKLLDCDGAGTEKQHKNGKLTARERIERFFDTGTFQESGLFVTNRYNEFFPDKNNLPYDGVITGFGLVGGEIVFAAFQDFRINGGTLGEMHAKKICDTELQALKAGAPFVFFADSGGARIQEGVDALAGFGDIFHANTQCSGIIPQISVILGPCAGGAVYSPALTDFIFTVDKISKMFITGPNVVKAVTGEVVDDQFLGGASMHNSVSGVAHFLANNEDECFSQIKKLLSYIPRNNFEIKEKKIYNENIAYSKRVKGIIPSDINHAYDVREIIRDIVDDSDYFEVQPMYAPNISVGFARMDGRVVGIVANNPSFAAGSLDINASDKAARFVRYCDSFNIPLLTLVDVPGFMPGSVQERGGIIRHGAKMLYAYSEATVPKVTVIIRKAFGGAYIAMCSKHLGADAVYAYPDSQIAVMGAEGACSIIYASELKNAADKESLRAERTREYAQKMMNPMQAAKRGFVDDIIPPEATRARVCAAFAVFSGKKTYKYEKKHGNIPL